LKLHWSEIARFRSLACPVDLLNEIQPVLRLVLCDGCAGSGRVGQLHRWTWPTSAFDAGLSSGTHAISLPESLELAGALGILPHKVTIWTIEIGQSGAGVEVAAELIQQVPAMARAILREEFEGAIDA
jgi:hypothetical protein